jgi:hypothetical protein
MKICCDCRKPTYRHGRAIRCRDCVRVRRQLERMQQEARALLAQQAKVDRVKRARKAEQRKALEAKRSARLVRLNAASPRNKRERERISAKRAADPGMRERERAAVRERMRNLRADPSYVRPEFRHR